LLTVTQEFNGVIDVDLLSVIRRWHLREGRSIREIVRQLHIDLVEVGYPGSYDRVAAFARDWRSRQQEAKLPAGKGTFAPLVFAPGEAFAFD
jgi:hypothetical protein